ncbi:hypothetical protein B0H21DRAFT_730066 [Amylocystis lapponica]|nr:hypothetical protein B0H21DRAFT_730066 [Amylocystis lapponica]
MEILDSEETVIPHSELTTHPCSSEADSSDDEPIRTTLIPVFPTEVFERIIDYSSQIVVGLWWYDTAPDYRTLRACALTCSAWLPRSRYNLLSTVRLTTKSQLMTLAQCLSATPHFCHLVRDLRVIYYTRGNVQPLLSFPAVLAHIFPHVTTLTLQSDGRGPIPGHLDTRFTPSFLPISGMTSITELNLIRISFGTPKECAYLVCELPNLRTLRCIRVYWNTSREGPMEIRRRQSASCLKLESLTIVTSGEHSGAFSILCDWTCFLHAVKHHLRRFHFTCINSRVRREEIPFLGTLRKLQSLALAATLSVNFLPEHFYKVLQKCSFVNTLHTLALVFSLDYRSREAIRNTYWARLDGLLTITFAHVETVSLRVFLGPSLTWTFNPEVLMPNLWTQRAVSVWKLSPSSCREVVNCSLDLDGLDSEEQDLLGSDSCPHITREAREYIFSRRMAEKGCTSE